MLFLKNWSFKYQIPLVNIRCKNNTVNRFGFSFISQTFPLSIAETLFHKLAPILCLKLLQVPIEMRILALNNLRHDTQLSSNPHFIKPEVVPSFLYKTYEAPEGIMVLLHHRNYWGE